MATNTMLPTSNPGGNNQTGPSTKMTGVSGAIPFQGGPAGSQNPYFANPGGPTLPSGSAGTQPPGSWYQGWGALPQGWNSPGSLYPSGSSYGSGETNIEKQLIDIYGKGVGGALNNLLAGMGGTDSQIFQQFLASMKPVWQQQQVGLKQGLGVEGVSGNSSVAGIAEADLGAQQSAQAAGVNSQLMQQQLQDTLSVLMGTKGDAAKEVATSGWDVFASVMNNVTGDIGNLLGGNYNNNPNPANIGSGDTNPQLSNLEMGAPPSDMGYGASQGLNTGSIDLSVFQ